MKPGMVQLKPERKSSPLYVPPKGHVEVPIAFAYPFYKGNAGQYFHRIRSGTTYVRHGDTSHASLSFWCGNSGSIAPEGKKQKGQMWAVLPPDAVLCATCEGRWVGAGMEGARDINGRAVHFSPRKKLHDSPECGDRNVATPPPSSSSAQSAVENEKLSSATGVASETLPGAENSVSASEGTNHRKSNDCRGGLLPGS